MEPCFHHALEFRKKFSLKHTKPCLVLMIFSLLCSIYQYSNVAARLLGKTSIKNIDISNVAYICITACDIYHK